MLAILLAASPVFISSAAAQQVGVSITPATIEETIDPGITQDFSVKIENLDSNEQMFYLFTRNIKGVHEGGVPIFAEDNLEVTGLELADWISLPVTEVLIAGRGTQTINFSVSVPDNASPGGHFGGIFVSADPPEMENSGAAVGYQVANIMNIRVSGEAIEQASIRQFATSRFFYGSQNVEFSVRIENSGNVLVRPVGPLEVFNMLGQKVGDMIFNETQAGVFPGATENFDGIKWEGDSIGFGRYEAILSPVYGDYGAKKTMSSTVTFWILPMNIIGPTLGLLAFIVLLTFFVTRLYIRRSLAHLQTGRRMVRQRRRGSSPVMLFLVIVLVVTALFLIALLALFA
ncbi:hypothetical protein KC906_04470 [Candidatus Kaiserbacteria bacterium]|nr:hypothetical protein [Candidatus Kaiserbacteria bacterium]